MGIWGAVIVVLLISWMVWSMTRDDEQTFGGGGPSGDGPEGPDTPKR